MKRLFPIMILASILAACNVYPHKTPHRTSSARAAYGDGIPDFTTHTKKNQRRKDKARREAKKKKPRNNQSYWHARPY